MKTVYLILAFSLAACNSIPLKDAVAIAEKDLGFKNYGIRVAPWSEVVGMCHSILADGCTSHDVSLVSNRTFGCYRTEVIFHELKHQEEFLTGTYVSEGPAYNYGKEMAAKYCR